MKNLFKIITIFSFAALTPFIAYAQNATNATDVLSRISAFFSALLPVLISLGVVYFIWGVVQYFIGDSDEAKTKGRDRIIYGIIGLAVIISVWGLVTIVVKTFGVGGQGAPSEINSLVSVPTSSSCSLGTSPKFQNVLNYFTCIINDSVIPLLFAVAVVMFIWGAVKFFIINSDEEAKREQGKQFMLWGIVAIAVMLSVWGLVGVLRATFGLKGSVLPQVKP